MGYHIHHAIVVTSWQQEGINAAKASADVHFAGTSAPVSDILLSESNGYMSFVVAPDGSKEGWAASDECDTARDLWVKDLAGFWKRNLYVDWAELSFGGDEGDVNTRIIRHSDDQTHLAEKLT